MNAQVSTSNKSRCLPFKLWKKMKASSFINVSIEYIELGVLVKWDTFFFFFSIIPLNPSCGIFF